MKVCVLFVVLLFVYTIAAASIPLTQAQVDAIVNGHNAQRRNPITGPASPSLIDVQYNYTIASEAAATAGNCKWAHSRAYGAGIYGESFMFSADQDSVVTAAIDAWAAEGKYYDINNGWCKTYNCMNYVQMVAATSVQVGCGLAKCDLYFGSGYVFVCNYRKYAQYPGKRPYTPSNSPTNAPTITTGRVSTAAAATSTTGVRPVSTTSTTGIRPSSTTTTTGGRINKKPSIDYRGTAMVVSMRDQGQCGSCWAFSATAIAEGAYGKKYGQTSPRLSEQDILDCSKGGSCNGGWPTQALQGMINIGGVDTNDGYPGGTYKARDQTCAHSSSAVGARLASQGTARGTFDEIYAALEKYGPVGIAVGADNTWYSYRSGKLSKNTNSINHAVTVVGYDDNQMAWIVKNSWGTSFGYGGYCYIDINAPYGANVNGAFYAVAA